MYYNTEFGVLRELLDILLKFTEITGELFFRDDFIGLTVLSNYAAKNRNGPQWWPIHMLNQRWIKFCRWPWRKPPQQMRLLSELGFWNMLFDCAD